MHDVAVIAMAFVIALAFVVFDVVMFIRDRVLKR